jgi:hypothetical protein
MKKGMLLLLCLVLTAPAFAQQYVVPLTFTADAQGAVTPQTLTPSAQNFLGQVLYGVQTVPGTPAPTDDWDIRITDGYNLDLLGTAGENRDANNPE